MNQSALDIEEVMVPQTLADLERELATEAAISDIECCCLRSDSEPFVYDLASVTDEDKDWLARAVRYLDMRQLLQRDPTNCSLVRIRESGA